jgi:2-desacetyl-2-hydroxyethyl bacteriochlorophyllide A dehydrogenase
MKTIVLDTPGHLRLTETAPPSRCGPGEALVRVRRVGICGTDLHAYRGDQPFFEYPRVLGHELGVEIVALGQGAEASGLSTGDRCAVEPYLNCGTCGACRRGRANCCARLRVIGVHIDGGMRELLAVPAAKLHRSETLSSEQLALVEMLSIGAHAVRRARVEQGEDALVIGAGPIGLSVMSFARLAGADVIAMDTSDLRLRMCRKALGLETVIDAKRDPLAQLQVRLSGELPTVVFDATGSGRSMTEAFTYTAQGGRLVLVGVFQGSITFHDPEFHRREMTVLSSRNATAEDFAAVMRGLDSRQIDPRSWITHRFPPEGAANAFSLGVAPDTPMLKSILEFS